MVQMVCMMASAAVNTMLGTCVAEQAFNVV